MNELNLCAPQAWEVLLQQQKMGCGLTTFLLEHGKRFDSVSMAPERGIPRECFKNAATIALANPDYLYCEGLAASARLPFSFPHAWLMDTNGRALEVTWDAPGQLYLGVVMTATFLYEQLESTKVWGILEGPLPPWFLSEPHRWNALPLSL